MILRETPTWGIIAIAVVAIKVLVAIAITEAVATKF